LNAIVLTGVFFQSSYSDVDANKIINIIQTKMIEEEKSKINSVLLKKDDVVVKK